MKFSGRALLAFGFIFLCAGALAVAMDSRNFASAADPVAVSLEVEGNEHVVKEHILSAVGTRVGNPISREQLQKDVDGIYGLGFFSFVDINMKPVPEGVALTYIVKENPVVEKITFSGNSIYKGEELMKVVFTMPGNVFNRVFFRHDLDRIQEKYNKDGYVMVKISDVQMDGGNIEVKISEPRVGKIIVQGNKRTKTRVIEREIKIKKGDPFNTTILRHSINKLQSKGFFEDVNVGFEQGETPEETDIILTVSEQKTGKIGLSVSHGTESGWSGGLTYTDTNWKGLGHVAEIGFETGDDEQYWLSYTEPYMDKQHYAWKAGFIKRTWEERNYYRKGVKQLEYDEDLTNIYLGFGRKFGRGEKLSWYLTADWREVEAKNIKNQTGVNDITTGKIFSLQGSVTQNNTDPYLSYPKGDVIDLNVEHAFEALGGEYSFTKYWLQARFYVPMKSLGEYIGRQLGDDDNPAIFAARLRLGYSSGDIPTVALYSLGGANTLRGYDKGEFEGSSMFLGNVELRVPMEKNFGFVVFYDVGNAWDSNSVKFDDLHDSWGLGVRVKTPLGNFRFDYAEGDKESRTHFGFGEMF